MYAVVVVLVVAVVVVVVVVALIETLQVLENAACLLFQALDGALGLVLSAFWVDLAPK